MLAIRRLRPIPLLAALLVLVAFITAIVVSLPRPTTIRAATVVAEDIAAPAPPNMEANVIPEAPVVTPPVMANEPPPPPEAAAYAPPTDAAADNIKPVLVSLPKLAYAYSLGFRLAGGKIAEAQEAHRALCEHMGPTRCQLMGMQRGEADDAQTSAHLKLRVATGEARAFSDAVTKSVAKAGGRPIQTSVSTEDVSKDIVDAVARIHQREMLVARLTDILRTRRGTVSELVEAERSVAAAQEELDQTRAWLTELRGRVAMSDFDITYQAVAPQASPEAAKNALGEATLGSGAAFLIAIRSLLTMLIYLAPWMLLIGLLYLAVRRYLPRLKRDGAPLQLPDDA